MMTVLDFEDAANTVQTAKRPGPPTTSIEPTKKRAPYAPRACDACRRRKGRCSGGNPCSYCFARSLHCGGAVNASTISYSDDPAPSLISDQEPSGLRKPLTPAPSYSSRTDSQRPDHHIPDAGRFEDHRSKLPVEELIANLQEQIGTLTTRLKLVESKNVGCDNDGANTGHEETRFGTSTSLSEGSSCFRRKPGSLRQRFGERSIHRKRFCGPTSPDYSLNVAQIRLCQSSFGERDAYRRPSLPSIDDNQSDDDESLTGDELETASGVVSSRSLEKLTGFRRLLSKSDASHLIQTYQDVFHSFHPILDIHSVKRQVEAWYNYPRSDSGPLSTRADPAISSNRHITPSTEEFTLLSINLVLAIALCAEPSSNVDVSKAIYAYCREAIHRTTICPAPDINNAVIALLVSTYHFFRDQLRFAWRMCGLAGVILLELGLHSRDFPEHLLGADFNRSQVIAIICTTIVLDRQWSAATGLPTHFQESHFKSAMKSPVDSPYLKAMVSFMAVSDKFTSAMAQRVSTGEPSEEDDSFDILNFQIEQWRKHSLGRYNMSAGGSGPTLPLEQIPSWAVLLNLRANAAHSMLLRPFFFTNKPTEGSRRNLGPALHFFSDTVNILSALDNSTSVYRMQLPFYVHLLASACALMSLVVVHIAQNKETLVQDLSDDFVEKICRTFRKAMDVASRHATTSRASHKLLKRLKPIGNLLNNMKTVPSERTKSTMRSIFDPACSIEDGRQVSVSVSRPSKAQRNLEPATVASARDHVPIQQQFPAEVSSERLFGSTHNHRLEADAEMYYAAEQPLAHNMPSFMMVDIGADGSTLPSASPNSSLPFSHNSSSLGEWPLVGGNAFFSEGELLFDE